MLRGVAFVFVLTSVGHGWMAYAQARNPGVAATVTWTAIGAGAGFGIGLWAGLTVFDDAINSERKVWTSAVVGAAAGALGGYLVGRARRPHGGPRPMTAPSFPSARTRDRCGPPGAECSGPVRGALVRHGFGPDVPARDLGGRRAGLVMPGGVSARELVGPWRTFSPLAVVAGAPLE